eukprot:227193-Rhodomonas_salina.1
MLEDEAAHAEVASYCKLLRVCYGMSGTDLQHASTACRVLTSQCPVLTYAFCRMLLDRATECPVLTTHPAMRGTEPGYAATARPMVLCSTFATARPVLTWVCCYQATHEKMKDPLNVAEDNLVGSYAMSYYMSYALI